MQYEIILPVHNQIGYTEYCIRRVFKNEGDYKLVVVNNGSSPETRGKLLELREDLPFVLRDLPTNKGWAKAVNFGIKGVHPKTDRVILLHNDCFVPSNLISYLDSLESLLDPQVGVLLPRTSYSREPALLAKSEIPKLFNGLKHGNKDTPLTVSEIETFLEKLYGSFEQHSLSYKNAKKLTFCHIPDTYCCVVDRTVFASVGLFNETFETTGWVEREWMDRAVKMGYEAWILNEVFVHHHGNLTTDGEGLNYGECYNRDQALYERLLNGDA